MVKKRTAVIARTNAVVCAVGMDLINAGCKVQIIGKDIAKDLKDTVGEVLGRKTFNTTLREFQVLLDGWMAETRKLCVDNNGEALDEKADFLAECEDFHRSLKAFSDRIAVQPGGDKKTVQALIDKINEAFVESDDVDPEAIVCATGHRAKGLEYERVIVVRTDLCPHPKASTEEEFRVENNLEYIMYTRAMEELLISCDNKPE